MNSFCFVSQIWKVVLHKKQISFYFYPRIQEQIIYSKYVNFQLINFNQLKIYSSNAFTVPISTGPIFFSVKNKLIVFLNSQPFFCAIYFGVFIILFHFYSFIFYFFSASLWFEQILLFCDLHLIWSCFLMSSTVFFVLNFSNRILHVFYNQVCIHCFKHSELIKCLKKTKKTHKPKQLNGWVIKGHTECYTQRSMGP